MFFGIILGVILFPEVLGGIWGVNLPSCRPSSLQKWLINLKSYSIIFKLLIFDWVWDKLNFFIDATGSSDNYTGE